MKIKVEIEGTSYTVSIENIHANPVLAEVDGKTYQVWAEPEEEPIQPATQSPVQVRPVAAAPASPSNTPVATGTATVTAPLPGVIVSIDIKPGDTVKSGQVLCTLEAMKMKNAIRSSREGVIAEVKVNVGDQVRHGQPLFTFQA